MRRVSRCLVQAGMLLLMLPAAQAQARPAHRRALADYFGPLLPKKLNDCRTCHLPDPPGTATDQLATEKPHNAWPARMRPEDFLA